MSWSTSELRVRLAPLNRFKPSSKIFYWPFQGGTSFVDLLCFCSVLCLLCFVRVCLYVLRGHLLGKGWPLGSRCGVFCEFVTFPLVSWVRCGTWLYRFLIFATLLTLTFYVFVECSSKELQLKYSLSLYSKRSNFFTLQLEKELREAQDGIYLKLGRSSDKKDDDKKYAKKVWFRTQNWFAT